MPSFDTGISTESTLPHDAFNTSMSQSDPFAAQNPTQPDASGFNSSMTTPYSQAQNWNQFNSGLQTNQNVQIPQTQSAQTSQASNRDMELILSRLDLIKSEIENVSHRITLLEQELHQKPKW